MPTPNYPSEIKINPNQGGKAAIERLEEAYGFTTRQALAEHLDVSKSTLANRYMRDTFPADWIIQCAFETDVPLNGLPLGKVLSKARKQRLLKNWCSFLSLLAKWLNMVLALLTHHFSPPIFHLRLLS